MQTVRPLHSPMPPNPMPEALFHKLDACGVSLTPAEWAALPTPARARLVRAPTDTVLERAAFASLLKWLVRTFPPPPAA